MKVNDHIIYYWAHDDVTETVGAHYDADLGDGMHRVTVRFPRCALTIEASQCDPATPSAGCWSVQP